MDQSSRGDSFLTNRARGYEAMGKLWQYEKATGAYYRSSRDYVLRYGAHILTVNFFVCGAFGAYLRSSLIRSVADRGPPYSKSNHASPRYAEQEGEHD